MTTKPVSHESKSVLKREAVQKGLPVPVSHDVEREKFEAYAEPIGLRCYEADCPCCTYFDEDTEIAYQAWNYATAQQAETIAVMQSTIDDLVEALEEAMYSNSTDTAMEKASEAIAKAKSMQDK